MRRFQRVAVAAAILVLAGLGGPGVAAQEEETPVPVGDACIGDEHFPEEPVNGDPSKIIVAGAFPPELAGDTFFLEMLGPLGPDTATGTIDERGIGQVELGIETYGPYEIGSAAVVNQVTRPVLPLDLGGGIVVTADEVPCSGDLLTPVTVTSTTTTTTPTTSTTSTSTTSTTSTTSSTTTTTIAATTVTQPPETTATTEDVSPPTSIEIIDDDGTSYVAWWWIGGILIVVGGGIFFFARHDDPCIPLKARWVKAQKACDDARRRLEERKEKLKEAEEGQRNAERELREKDARGVELRRQLAQLEAARTSWVESGGTRFHRIPEGLVTADGLESIIGAVKDQLASHDRDVQSWKDSVERWKEIVKDHQRNVDEAQAEVDEKCAEAAKARKAYEECIKQQSAPEPAPPPPPTGGEEGPSTGGTGGGEPGGGTPGGPSGPGGGPAAATGGGAQPQPQCNEGETREEELKRQSFTVPKNTGSLRISIDPPTEEFADWLAEQMAGSGGWLSPLHLNDPGFAGEVRETLRGLDTGYGVSHEVTISFPRQQITYACIQHWVCRGGTWVKTHTETREVARGDLPDMTFSESGKVDSRTVSQLIGRAQSAYRQLAANDDSISRFCP